MRKTIILSGVCLLAAWGVTTAVASNLEQKLVIRVDFAAAVLKRKTLTVFAVGMGRNPTAMGRGGKLVRRKSDRPLNKDGLVEYDLVFNGVPNYTGFTMKPISAKVSERSVPDGVKGVRVFGELNSYDGLLPEPKPKQSKSLLHFGKKKEKESQETTEGITGSSPHP